MTQAFRADLFTGKTILVSGGTSGIGLAIARGFAAAGGTVIATGSSQLRIKAAKNTAGETLRVAQLDVRDSAAITDFMSELGQLDVLVNSQGVARPDLEWEEETFLDVMDINLNSVMRLSRAAHPLLVQSKGTIINVASMLSFLADPAVPSYCASKTGIVGLTRAMAHQYGKDSIRVNAIAPGYHKTDMTKAIWSDPPAAEKIVARTAARRWGSVDDLVGPTLFLASDSAAFVTGAILPVDGGYHTG